MSDERCPCAEPGYCPEYGFELTGWFFDICHGRGVDAETAAKYRRLWAARKAAGLTAPPPSLGQKLVNFADAAARHVATGARKVPLEVFQERRAVCDSCDIRDPVTDTCSHPSCGCRLSPSRLLPSKLEWAEQRCPRGLWGPHEGPVE